VKKSSLALIGVVLLCAVTASLLAGCGGAATEETTTTAAGQATTTSVAGSTDTTEVASTDATAPAVDYPQVIYSIWEGMGGAGFDLDKWKATAAAAKLLAMEKNGFIYTDEMDPAVLAYWDALGVKKELHDADDPALKWASYTPVAALEAGSTTKCPVVFCFHGGGGTIFQAEGYGIADLGAKKGYITVCPGTPGAATLDQVTEGLTAGGQVVRVLDALEAEGYPIDRSRVYVTGQSMGGMASAWAGLEMPEVVTAIAMHSSGAALNTDPSGVGQVSLSIPAGDYAKAMNYDVPMYLELGDFDFAQLPIKTEGIISGLNLWLQLNNCPTQVKLADSLAAAASSTDPAVKLIGLAGDKTWTETIDGVVYHAVDYFRADGVKMVEIVGVENQPHWVTAAYPELAWDFMSKFSKDADGNLIVAK
jgi:poly(3-hydroxybutyrate) depolymerase